jgi:tetratricopeptide (TPR) repeat protein
MEQFSIPRTAFDVTLLPIAARDPATPEFEAAVADFFQQQFRELGANGQVAVTPDQISVSWVTAGFNAVEAALAKLRRGQLRDGIQLLALLRSRWPDQADVLYNLGVALSELGEPAKAVPVLRHLVAVEPEHTHGRVALGVALGRLGDPAAAEQEFRAAVANDPAEPWARKNLGGILLRQGRWNEAREHLKAALQRAPEDAQAWLLLGEVAGHGGDNATAKSAWQRARQLDPDGPVGERAERILNRLAGESLPRNADGVNPEAVAAMVSALKRLRALSPEAARQLTLQAALLGQHGLRLQDPERRHQVEGIAEPLTGLEVACLIHAGVQLASPGAETGLPLKKEYHVAAREHGL